MKIEPLEVNNSRPNEHETNSTAASAAKSAAEQHSFNHEPRQQAPKRNSKRGTKIKKDAETGGGDNDKDEELLCTAGENIKRRRTWELWSASDKHIFFDALNEVGKDFDSIQQHFQAKFKTTRSAAKAPVPAHYIKNKNQIRHFYYRTWHKISPHLQFGPNIKKSTRELYGLVNYGELWKKVGGTLGGKLGPKLNELVQKGSTALKLKGKTMRVRTPVCRALKELHSRAVGGAGDVPVGGAGVRGLGQPKLPNKVIISLRPRHTADWIRVQKIAQNPHVRLTVGLQRRVVSLLRCLTAKWQQPEAKIAASLGASEDRMAEILVDEQLVLLPRKGAKINIPVISAAPVLTSSDIGLQNMPPDDEPVPLAATADSGFGCEESGPVSVALGHKRPRVRFKFVGLDAIDTLVQEVGDNCPFSTTTRLAVEEEEEMVRQPTVPVPVNRPPPHRDADGFLQEGRLTPKSRKRKLGELFHEDFVLTEDSEAESSRSPGGPQTDIGSDRESDTEAAADGPGSSQPTTTNGARFKKEEDGEEEEDGVKQEESASTAAVTVQRDPTLGWDLHTAGSLTVGELFWMLGEEGGGAGFQLDYTWQGGSRDQDHHCQVRRVGTVPITGKVPYSCNNQCKKINVIQMRTGGVVTVTLRTGTGYVLEIKKKRERFLRKLVPGYRYTVPTVW